ncbi:hypothetical protein ACFQ4O_13645 [Methylopila musalis]|uniref:Cyclic nucleotide-binding domain-containing protein n=1 Tax=Methylopila musalis TaxID=1134781 RepID=A0ABW3ZA21_9HYPH
MPLSLSDELAVLPVFAAFAPATRAALAEHGVERAVAAGETLLSRDRDADSFLFLLDGRWTMRRFVRGVAEPLVWRDEEPGAWASGVAALEAIAPTDLFADRPCRVIDAPRTLAHELMAADPAFAGRILRDIHRWAERLSVHAALMRARSG